MDDTIEATKKYWPWALGIVGVIFVVTKLRGGESTSSGGGLTATDYAALATQNASVIAASGNAQAQVLAQQTELTVAGYNYDIAQKTLANNMAIATMEANARELTSTYQGQSNMIAAEAGLVKDFGAAQTAIINANNALPLAAIQASTVSDQLNIAGLNLVSEALKTSSSSAIAGINANTTALGSAGDVLKSIAANAKGGRKSGGGLGGFFSSLF